MKCPKCRYLSFEPELRCKHCGYDFSLAESSAQRPSFDELEQQDPDMPMVDLQLRSTEIDTPPAPEPALSRIRTRPEPPPARRPAAAAVALADKFDREAPKPAPAPRPMPMPTPTPELPLFLKKGVTAEASADVVDDEDLLWKDEDQDREGEESFLRVPAAPRPLVVRRRAPDTPRPAPVAAPARVASLSRRDGDDLLDYLRRADTQPLSTARALQLRPSPVAPVSEPSTDIDARARLKAAAVDFGVLLALNVTVILLTLRQCDLPVTGVMQLPMIPMVGFLASLTVGYLLMFNVVSARTIGKMIFGLHVVADSRDSDVELAPTQRQLSYRALLTVPSVLLLGLGFLPGLVGEGLAVHDRLTHTRVVRE